MEKVHGSPSSSTAVGSSAPAPREDFVTATQTVLLEGCRPLLRGEFLTDHVVPFCQFTGAVTRLPVQKSDITGADVPVPGLQDTHVIAHAGCFRFPQNVFLSKILVGVKLLAIDEVVHLTPCAIVRSYGIDLGLENYAT